MANHLKYLDFVGLAKYNETVNQRLYKRLKYMGELELNAATRVDWNDIAPCTIGHMYVLTGEKGDRVTIDDVTYKVGDTIYAINDVSGTQTTAVDVQINKINGASDIVEYVDELPTEKIDAQTMYAIPFYKNGADDTQDVPPDYFLYYIYNEDEEIWTCLNKSQIVKYVEELPVDEDEIDDQLVYGLVDDTTEQIFYHFYNKDLQKWIPLNEHIILPVEELPEDDIEEQKIYVVSTEIDSDEQLYENKYYVYDKEHELWTCLNEGKIFEYVDELPEEDINDQLIYGLRDGDKVKCFYFDKEEDVWRPFGTDAIEIVERLPQEDINDKIFYAIPHVPGYAYGTRKYYGLLDGSTNEIRANGIYDENGQPLLLVKDITSEDDVLVYCQLMTSMDQTDSLPGYILAYTLAYDDGTSEVVWCTKATAPYDTGAVEWQEHFDEKDFAVYVYNAQAEEWNCIFPAEAESIRWFNNIEDIEAPKSTMFYGLYGQTDIKYYEMPEAEKTAGSTITAAGVTLVNAGITLTYADIAANPTDLNMLYGFTEVAEGAANDDCVVVYKVNGESAASPYSGFELRDKSELYIYNGSDFEIIYPPEPNDDVVKFLEVDREEYEKILDGTSTENEYEESTIYTIKDPERKNAPEAYFQKKNIWNNKAILEVDELPDGTALDDADLSCLYKLTASESKYSEIEYYTISDPTITIEPSEVDSSVIVLVRTDADGTRTELMELVWVRDDPDFDANVANGLYVKTTAADCAANGGFVTVKEIDSGDAEGWVVYDVAEFDPTASVEKSELYFYSPDEEKWVCIYPSAVEFEDLDINFYDPDEWFPIMI